jgi:arginase family enzyme
MPLRKLIDSGAVDAGDVALVGARNLYPPEEAFIREQGIQVGEEGIVRALEGADCTYIAFDADVLEPSELSMFMPEPGGLSVADAERILQGLSGRTNVVGAGFTGAGFEPADVVVLARLASAAGL